MYALIKKYILMFFKIFMAILTFLIICMLLMEVRLYVGCGFSSLCSKKLDCLDEGGRWNNEKDFCEYR
jgi:hypothetical protein